LYLCFPKAQAGECKKQKRHSLQVKSRILEKGHGLPAQAPRHKQAVRTVLRMQKYQFLYAQTPLLQNI